MSGALLMIFGGLSIFSALIALFAYVDGERAKDAIGLGLSVGFGLPALCAAAALACKLVFEGVSRVIA